MSNRWGGICTMSSNWEFVDSGIFEDVDTHEKMEKRLQNELRIIKEEDHHLWGLFVDAIDVIQRLEQKIAFLCELDEKELEKDVQDSMLHDQESMLHDKDPKTGVPFITHKANSLNPTDKIQLSHTSLFQDSEHMKKANISDSELLYKECNPKMTLTCDAHKSSILKDIANDKIQLSQTSRIKDSIHMKTDTTTSNIREQVDSKLCDTECIPKTTVSCVTHKAGSLKNACVLDRQSKTANTSERNINKGNDENCLFFKNVSPRDCGIDSESSNVAKGFHNGQNDDTKQMLNHDLMHHIKPPSSRTDNMKKALNQISSPTKLKSEFVSKSKEETPCCNSKLDTDSHLDTHKVTCKQNLIQSKKLSSKVPVFSQFRKKKIFKSTSDLVDLEKSCENASSSSKEKYSIPRAIKLKSNHSDIKEVSVRNERAEELKESTNISNVQKKDIMSKKNYELEKNRIQKVCDTENAAQTKVSSKLKHPKDIRLNAKIIDKSTGNKTTFGQYEVAGSDAVKVNGIKTLKMSKLKYFSKSEVDLTLKSASISVNLENTPSSANQLHGTATIAGTRKYALAPPSVKISNLKRRNFSKSETNIPLLNNEENTSKTTGGNAEKSKIPSLSAAYENNLNLSRNARCKNRRYSESNLSVNSKLTYSNLSNHARSATAPSEQIRSPRHELQYINDISEKYHGKRAPSVSTRIQKWETNIDSNF